MRIHAVADFNDVFVIEPGDAKGKGVLPLKTDDGGWVFDVASADLCDVNQIDQLAPTPMVSAAISLTLSDPSAA